MQLTDQVTNLELSRRLKELNVKQQSLFYWADTRKSWKENNQVAGSFVPFNDMSLGDPELEIHLGYEQAKNAMAPYNEGEPLSAFTASDIGERLPARTKWDIEGKWSNDWMFRIYFRPPYYPEKQKYMVNYYGDDDLVLLDTFIIDDSMPDAMAKMLVYLIEQGLVKV